ncbi:hypothetical protein OG762_49130 (plasmid) [Streptomyces sp. NBC_01136]|uniref:hypothetical protein n=1 Tax=unclassified Streptomyces TaxID=2593676 RepID=UPI002F90A19D|nr:hypothetical protein OG762_49130 [Streptomyces sp. NBC_01136]
MHYLRGFIPWIVFAAVAGFGWQWGALSALVIGVWLIIGSRSAGVARDALVLEGSTVVYFAAVTALAFAQPHSGLHPWTGVLSFCWLAATAWATLAIGRPFTLGIARRSTPREVWDTPQFLHVNVVITRVWAIAFTLTAAAQALCHLAHAGTAATTACQVLGFLAPVVFTSRYPKVMQARWAAAMAAQRLPAPDPAAVVQMPANR